MVTNTWQLRREHCLEAVDRKMQLIDPWLRWRVRWQDLWWVPLLAKALHRNRVATSSNCRKQIHARCVRFRNLRQEYLKPAQGAIRKIFATCACARICGGPPRLRSFWAPLNGHFELRNRSICTPACIISTFRPPKRSFWAPESPHLHTGMHYLNFSTSKTVILSSEIAVFAQPACIISTFRPPKRSFWAPKSPYLHTGVHYLNFSTSKTVILSSKIAVFATPACIISTFRPPKRSFWAPKSPYASRCIISTFRPPKRLPACMHYLNFSTSKTVILSSKIAVFASRRALSQLFDLQNGHFELRNRRIC